MKESSRNFFQLISQRVVIQPVLIIEESPSTLLKLWRERATSWPMNQDLLNLNFTLMILAES